MATEILAKDLHLSAKERTIKQATQYLIQQLEHLQTDLSRRHSDLERISFDHFSEIRRHIDIQREELDEIALKMIDRVNENEKDCNSKIKNPFFLPFKETSSRIDIAG